MPRGPRIVPEEGTFHITLRGNNKRRVFRYVREYKYFLSLLERFKGKYNFFLYHYVLMINHIHLCLKISLDTDLAKLMQGLELAFFQYHHKHSGYVGHIWQGKYFSRHIHDDSYLLTSSLYIERNPVDACIVDDPADYRWSSYRYYAFGEDNPLIDPNPFYPELGKDVFARRRVYKKLMDDSIKLSKDRKLSAHSLQIIENKKLAWRGPVPKRKAP